MFVDLGGILRYKFKQQQKLKGKENKLEIMPKKDVKVQAHLSLQSHFH